VSPESKPLDVDAVLGSLKDFQRASVDYVFQRLYLDEKPARRFLVADEVGLGKTLVARGVTAKAIEHLTEKDIPRIDIVYICSNADIARQNINRLNVTGQDDFALASRITLLPVTLKDLKKNRLNFVSFTPGTTFDLRSSMGTRRERALLYWLLKDAWDLKGTGPLNLLQGSVGRDKFRTRVDDFRDRNEIDETLKAEFERALKQRVESAREAGRPDLRTRFHELAERFRYGRETYPRADRRDQRELVGELRSLLATTCLTALEPDLIILDEFQRFKHLLEGEDDASELARNLFEYPEARVLLLSATPYKMYTLEHEAGTEDHYEDFVRTVSFLQGDPRRTDRFKDLLGAYRREALTCADGDLSGLREAKAQLEGELRRVMIRTERLGVSEDRSGMLKEIPAASCRLEPGDVDTYLSLQRIARALDQPDTLEYWKAAPYLLSFMDEYDFKEEVKEAIENGGEEAREIARALQGGRLSLRGEDLSTYQPIDPGNARMRSLLKDTVGRDMWRLLWLPASLPYYQLEGAYKDTADQSLTKRLVFSSWRVVPKVIAGVLSYEAERRMMQSLDPQAENTPEARKRRRGLLQFRRETDGLRLAGMPVLGLLYPSLTLAEQVDPLAIARECGANGSIPALAAVLDKATERADALLQDVFASLKKSAFNPSDAGPVDENWYWAAPILIDRQRRPGEVHSWLNNQNTPAAWAGRDAKGKEAGGEDDDSLWDQHVAKAAELQSGRAIRLGRPPEDLARVVALLGLAGPGVAAARSLARSVGGTASLHGPTLRNAAGAVAWAFRNLFNLPESMALVRDPKNEEPYWLRVLAYCADGGLQSTLDEYVHVLKESLGLIDKPPDQTIEAIGQEIRDALSLRTAGLNVDLLTPKDGTVAIQTQRMRARFATRFGQEKSDEDGGAVNRAEQVRSAFNSPFWPFVLATTSVGQEGLDFHPYCHAVVHWNLPSNPVDLEQREGRVHRYKGHAVRKNLAKRYGLTNGSGANGVDPWVHLFAQAAAERGEASDVMPYWVFAVAGGALIERHVPALPLSRETDRLERLRRSLAAYRMVFGQARQEELLAYLLSHFPEGETARLAEDLRVDLAPRPLVPSLDDRCDLPSAVKGLEGDEQ
jgi:hypothetical protein